MQDRSLGWEDPLEEDLATHSSTLAWRISWTEERGGLRSIGSHRVGHDWRDLACMHKHLIVLDTNAVTAEQFLSMNQKFLELKFRFERCTNSILKSLYRSFWLSHFLFLCSQTNTCWYESNMGLSWGCSGWESASQCKGNGFDTWSERIPHARCN